jgi:hypothetical protein
MHSITTMILGLHSITTVTVVLLCEGHGFPALREHTTARFQRVNLLHTERASFSLLSIGGLGHAVA